MRYKPSNPLEIVCLRNRRNQVIKNNDWAYLFRNKKNVVLNKKQKASRQLHLLNFVMYLDPMSGKEDNNRNYKRRGIYIKICGAQM